LPVSDPQRDLWIKSDLQAPIWEFPYRYELIGKSDRFELVRKTDEFELAGNPGMV
jgi:hypothetical protein